uniref:Calmodulin n=1 Tax=Caligus rogercresseyi TaxID=217165 RepID=C1BR42_CALRO|nr:Calmodulin [Caligus rogercresseyi]|eukprot:TRINITY_DN712_c1_g2_i1.p1 TRINITY_DN712_c1_g2~~TRINITY_DN712_c1_g2_i1.p1  ORF type:complete len:161 (+),score=59.94 TRINITY_DN712_c1_g2_i1:31-483(+)
MNVSELIPGEEISRFLEAFNRFDEDSDGLITTGQLGKILHYLGQSPTEAELQDLYVSMDTDGSGTIDLPEFIQSMAKRLARNNLEDEITEAFKVFDKDGNGLISSKELKVVMSNIGEILKDDEVEALIKEADVDGDGSINYAEFFTLFAE